MAPPLKMFADSHSPSIPQLNPMQKAEIQDLCLMFPKVDSRTIYSTFTNNGKDKEKTCDSLIALCCAKSSMGPKAQELTQSAADFVHTLQKNHVHSTFTDFQKNPPKKGVVGSRGKAGQGPPCKARSVARSPEDLVQESGRRRALLIGVNYFGTSAELSGCINDTKRMKKLITEVYGFPDEPNCMTILTDDQRDRSNHPTRQNILLAIGWLVKDARPGDVLFFHYSGHGAQSKDLKGTEIGGMNETICPCDYQRNGQIVDDELNAALVSQLADGVRLTAIMDCCHSGTGMDLPFLWEKRQNKWSEEPCPKFTDGDVQMFSGCNDEQTSADLNVPNWGSGGAMSLSLISTLAGDPFGFTYVSLLDAVHASLKARGFSQRPQLSSSQKFRTDRPFSFNAIHPNTNPILGQVGKKPPTSPSPARPPASPTGGRIHSPPTTSRPPYSYHTPQKPSYSSPVSHYQPPGKVISPPLSYSTYGSPLLRAAKPTKVEPIMPQRKLVLS